MSSSHPTDDQSAGGDARERCLAVAARFAAGHSFSDPGWPELDASLLEDRRAPVPPFPLHVLPQPWRDWVADTARSTGAPADYVAQAVLGAAAGLCGAGAAVQVTPGWAEPLVLWQALIGASSSGKSPALASVRHLLTTIEGEQAAGEAGGVSRTLIADVALDAVAKAVTANPRGVLLWRDEPAPWFAELAGSAWQEAWAANPVSIPHAGTARQLARFPVSILATMQHDSLQEMFQQADHGLAARLLYGWPDLPPYCPLAERKPARDDQALAMLRRIARKARTPDDPLVLVVDAQGQQEFDGFLARLHDERRQAEGIEAGWLGKGGGTVARLAGIIELLAWSGLASSGLPGHIGRDQVAAAVELWNGYFRPHARAVFDRATLTTSEGRVRRVARWLKDSGATVVSREDIRCRALGRTVNADGAQQVLYRLDFLGFVRPDRADDHAGPGRPARRWQVNPALADA